MIIEEVNAIERGCVMKILLFWINSSLKSLLSGFKRWISNGLYQKEQPIITFLLFFVEIASKL